jgi:hypothetical protein
MAYKTLLVKQGVQMILWPCTALSCVMLGIRGCPWFVWPVFLGFVFLLLLTNMDRLYKMGRSRKNAIITAIWLIVIPVLLHNDIFFEHKFAWLECANIAYVLWLISVEANVFRD